MVSGVSQGEPKVHYRSVLILLLVEYGIGYRKECEFKRAKAVLILLFVEQITNFRISELASDPLLLHSGCVKDAPVRSDL